MKEHLSESRALLPGASPEEAWGEVTTHASVAKSLMLVGHNPLFAQLAGYLLGTPHAQIEFKKGALMRIDFQALGSKPKGVLRWYLTASLAVSKEGSRS